MSDIVKTLKVYKEHSVMLDLETLGITPGSVICSIGAVEFNLDTGEIYNTFHQRVDIQSCLDVGLTVAGSTLDFWFKQSDAAREEVCGGNRLSIQNVLTNFSSFLQSVNNNIKNLRIYGNSSDFDCSILAAAYNTVKIPIPWMFWGTRCVRTIAAIYPHIKKSTKFEGVLHNPIDDCKHQISYLTKILQEIKHMTKSAHEVEQLGKCEKTQVRDEHKSDYFPYAAAKVA